MLANISYFVKSQLSWLKGHFNTIMLVMLVMLFVLFSFATGYIIAKYQDREPIKIENRN